MEKEKKRNPCEQMKEKRKERKEEKWNNIKIKRRRKRRKEKRNELMKKNVTVQHVNRPATRIPPK